MTCTPAKKYGTVQHCTAISVLKYKYDRSITRFKTFYSTYVYNHTVDENKFVYMYTNNYEFCRFLSIISLPLLVLMYGLKQKFLLLIRMGVCSTLFQDEQLF